MKLRTLDKKDIPFILEWMHDETIGKWFRFDSMSKTFSDVEHYINSIKANEAELHYALTDDADEYLGTVSLKNIDLLNREAEYAISLRTKAMGTGAAIVATDLILEIAFHKINLNRVYLNVLSENIRANKFYLKYGFVFEGEFRQCILHQNEFKNLKWYSILREEFYERA